ERAAGLWNAPSAGTPPHSARIQPVGCTLGGDLVGQIWPVYLFNQRPVESCHGRSIRRATVLPAGPRVSPARTRAHHFLGRSTGAISGLVAVCERRERRPPATHHREERMPRLDNADECVSR